MQHSGIVWAIQSLAFLVLGSGARAHVFAVGRLELRQLAILGKELEERLDEVVVVVSASRVVHLQPAQ